MACPPPHVSRMDTCIRTLQSTEPSWPPLAQGFMSGERLAARRSYPGIVQATVASRAFIGSYLIKCSCSLQRWAEYHKSMANDTRFTA